MIHRQTAKLSLPNFVPASAPTSRSFLKCLLYYLWRFNFPSCRVDVVWISCGYRVDVAHNIGVPITCNRGVLSQRRPPQRSLKCRVLVTARGRSIILQMMGIQRRMKETRYLCIVSIPHAPFRRVTPSTDAVITEGTEAHDVCVRYQDIDVQDWPSRSIRTRK